MVQGVGLDLDDVGPDHPAADQTVAVGMTVAEAGVILQALRLVLGECPGSRDRGYLQTAYSCVALGLLAVEDVRATIADVDP